MAHVPAARHLLRAKDLADARYFDPIGVDDMAAAAGLSRAHFSREFRRAFGETPRAYLLTRRLERAAAMLRTTDRSVSDICLSVGLVSQGSFTTSFARMFGMSPMEVRSDVTLPEMGDFRWLTVGPAGQDDFAITLLAIPDAPVMDEATADQVPAR